MIDEIDILQDCKSRHFGRYAGEESLWLLCVIAYHHELIIELREESSTNRYNKIKVLKRAAYGYRDEEYFRLRLFALHDARITRNVG